MLRKVLTLGMVFILALSLLLVSMVTCFTYDAQAHGLFRCVHLVGPNNEECVHWDNAPIEGMDCEAQWHTH